MKEIKAYIRLNKAEEVIHALEEAGVPGLTAIEVKAMANKRNIKLLAVAVSLLFMAMLPTYSLAEEVSPINPELVCMVNDSVMKAPQIAVQVEGKTYYGCCAGCVNTLQNDRSVRIAKDPLTGHEVDKATAFILADPKMKGKALYFESQETAREYLSKKGKGKDKNIK